MRPPSPRRSVRYSVAAPSGREGVAGLEERHQVVARPQCGRRAAGPEGLVPEPAVETVEAPRPDVGVPGLVVVVAGRAAVVDLAHRDREVEVLGPQLGD